jgi:spermidine/putrescine transport system permease protein
MSDRLVTGALRCYIVVAFGFIFAPIVALVVFSVEDQRFPTLPWTGFTTRWYRSLNDDSEIFASLRNSLVVAVVVAVIATFLGSTAAYFLNRWNFRGKSVYLAITVLPPCIPLVILGLAVLVFFSRIGLLGSLKAVIISQVGLASAFVVGIVRMRLAEMDRQIEEAAWNLGASQLRAIRYAVLPQAVPAIVAAFFLAMAVSWDEFVMAWFLSGFDVTVPVKIYAMLTGNVSPEINAIGTIVVAFTITLVVLAQVFFFVVGRRETKGIGKFRVERPLTADNSRPL